MIGKDPYASLGVTQSATQDDIKAAYRELAKKFHPDLNPGSKEVERRFKEINEAYSILSDPKKREEFDQFGKSESHGADTRRSRGPFYYETQEPYKSALYPVLKTIEKDLITWVRRKYKRLKGHHKRAKYWLGRIALREPNMFVHWRYVRSPVGKMGAG